MYTYARSRASQSILYMYRRIGFRIHWDAPISTGWTLAPFSLKRVCARYAPSTNITGMKIFNFDPSLSFLFFCSSRRDFVFFLLGGYALGYAPYIEVERAGLLHLFR